MGAMCPVITSRAQRQRRYSRLVARTARRDVIGLLIAKKVNYTDVEVDALIAQAKTLAKNSGRTVRDEAEVLLSRDGEARLRDLRNMVVRASEILKTITVKADELRANSDHDDGELVAILATMAAACEHFTAVRTGSSASTTAPGEPPPSTEAPSRPNRGIKGLPS